MMSEKNLSLTPSNPAAPPRTSSASSGMTLFVMIVATLYFGKEVLVPVTLALLLAFILAPLVDVLRRIYLGRIPSVLLGVLLALSVISAIGGVIGSQIGELSTDLPNYVSTLDAKIATVKHYTIGTLAKLANEVGQHKDGSIAQSLSTLQSPLAQPPTPTKAAVAPIQTTGPLDFAQRYLSAILLPLGNLGIVFIVTVFALLQREDLRDRLIRLIGSDDLHRTTLAIDDAGRRLSKYFVTQLSVNTVYGIVIGIGLLIIGVPNPVLWAILSALLRFVPYVGPLIAVILPMALSAAVEPGWSMMLSTAALYLTVEGLTGQAVEPLLYGHSTGMSPFSVVVAAIFWSWLWGPVGLILSTPLTLCLVVMGRHIKQLEFLDVMLGDKSPLTPIESFYQRILAGDADEVQDLAEKLLKSLSLSSYYDVVAIKGLQLAAHDAARQALDGHQLDRVRHTVKLLVHGLEKYADAKPMSSRLNEEILGGSDEKSLLPYAEAHKVSMPSAELPVVSGQKNSHILSIAGRGPLDEPVAMMLAQLLGKHGLNGRVVTYTEVSREQIASLNVTDISMVCISYLDISGNPAHLRYLVQRLRQRLPAGVPILVGIWSANDKTLSDYDTKNIIGADYFTISLEQAVRVCVDVAQSAK